MTGGPLYQTAFIIIGCLLWSLVWEITGRGAAAQMGAQPGDQQKSLRAFSTVASVLTSPRCLNCHIPGDSPLQGDAGSPHNMNVKRGADGRGTPAMQCRNCHQDANSQQLHGPPGRPDWRLPPASMRMAWQGLTVGDVCRSLKDPAKNGNRSSEQLIEHVRDDPIVNWSWNPGPDRSIPPVSHDEFVASVTEWVRTGALCPQ
jgi:hypothetical protein